MQQRICSARKKRSGGIDLSGEAACECTGRGVFYSLKPPPQSRRLSACGSSGSQTSIAIVMKDAHWLIVGNEFAAMLKSKYSLPSSYVQRHRGFVRIRVMEFDVYNLAAGPAVVDSDTGEQAVLVTYRARGAEDHALHMATGTATRSRSPHAKQQENEVLVRCFGALLDERGVSAKEDIGKLDAGIKAGHDKRASQRPWRTPTSSYSDGDGRKHHSGRQGRHRLLLRRRRPLHHR